MTCSHWSLPGIATLACAPYTSGSGKVSDCPAACADPAVPLTRYKAANYSQVDATLVALPGLARAVCPLALPRRVAVRTRSYERVQAARACLATAPLLCHSADAAIFGCCAYTARRYNVQAGTTLAPAKHVESIMQVWCLVPRRLWCVGRSRKPLGSYPSGLASCRSSPRMDRWTPPSTCTRCVRSCQSPQSPASHHAGALPAPETAIWKPP